MPSELMALIERINCSESDKITCLIAYACMGLALEVAEKMGIKKLSSFLDGRATLFALLFRIPSLIDDGIMDSDGLDIRAINKGRKIKKRVSSAIVVEFLQLKIGLGLKTDDSGIIRHGKIKNKLEQLLGDERFKERVFDLQTKILTSFRGGSSYKNFNDF
ncbi:UDP-glucuronosyl/UDP-glucosyltransferase [Abeliophyllum distichum]|uniref:UDP-glucuronosyl/UDP-glucosyltransferase n=1 Tax=Abeliophyllum distichum TaxID=126358 RepID=A0ABD1PC88_9LAMI